MKLVNCGICTLAGLVFAAQAHAVSVTPNNNPSALSSALNGGHGVTVTGSSVSGDPAQFGTFSGGPSSGIGFSSGVILSTGRALDAEGPNGSDSTTSTFARPGAGPNPGGDAAILDISFTTTTGALYFNYVFASEEFNEFANSQFNDGFLALLNGLTLADNIAIVPGTTEPVSVNSVNGGNPLGTAASNPGHFINNDRSDGGPFFDIEYDGFTEVFSAEATGLDVAAEHTISLIIQDVPDTLTDSAVFLQGGSFSGVSLSATTLAPAVVPIPATLPLLFAALVGFGWVSRRRA